MDGLAFLIIKRLFYGLLTLLALSVIIFFMVELLPGDTATSLLAMVDASIGGKNGVDFLGLKN